MEDTVAGSRLSRSSTLEQLLQHNHARLELFLQNAFFVLLRDDTLVDVTKRQIFLDCVQLFSNFFQVMMFARQATCKDKTYQSLFLSHLQEELGHDTLLAARDIKNEINDPILKAVSSWFCYQMWVLDNIEKTALVHLVLETSGEHYHKLAKEKVAHEVHSSYYDIHTEAEEHHTAMGVALLQGHSAKTYHRLSEIIDEGWDMLSVMTGRVAELVHNS